MASFEKISKGYRAHVQVKGQRDSATFPNKKEAQLWAAQKTIELQTIAKGQAGALKTTHDAFIRYADEVAVNHKGERWEVVRLTKMAREFPSVFLDKLNDTHVQAWRDKRLSEVSPASVLREMKLLNSVFEQCRRDWKWLASNPCTDVRRPVAPPHRDRIITRKEICTMLRALGYPQRTLPRHAVAHAFLLALFTGMRQGELASLKWANVFDSHVRLEDTKNGLPRDVPLSGHAKAALSKMRGYHDTLVFSITASSIDTHFRNAKARAGLTGFVWHDSRHTAATRIGRSGKWSLMELCKAFGWSDPKMAMIYFNPTASELAAKL